MKVNEALIDEKLSGLDKMKEKQKSNKHLDKLTVSALNALRLVSKRDHYLV